MEDNNKELEKNNIHSPRPQRPYPACFSPASLSGLGLSPLPLNAMYSPYPYFPSQLTLSNSPSKIYSSSLNLVTPITADSSKLARKNIKKIDFSIYADGFGMFKANTLPVEIKIFQDESFEHSNLLASLSKSKPQKRQRAKDPDSKVSCTCPKSKCLKLYCECFSRMVYCDGCSCFNCHNTKDSEEARKEAIESALERNPFSFRPKLAATSNDEEQFNLNFKGCKCNKSACRKNYCECFQRGASCTQVCQCSGCKNFDQTKKQKKSQKK